MDPIPKSIKQHFFTDKLPPNLSKDYEAIGFDADHCLVKYKIKALTQHLVRLQLRDLHESAGYPEEIMDFDLSHESTEI